MPWYLPFSDNIKKRACRYLLQRYLGQFLEEKLTLDQLTVNLYNGTGSVSDVVLDVKALNELGEQQNLPFEFVDGFIEEMSVSIPWASLFTDSSFVLVSGLVLTVQPKEREDSGASMFDSMWSSMMTSSIQMAAECLEQDAKETDQGPQLEGLEKFAQAIDSILTRVKVKFVDALLRVEYMPKDSQVGVGLEIKVKNIDYCDEAGFNMDAGEVPSGERLLHSAAFTASKFHCEGVTLYTDEFPADNRTMSRSLIKISDEDSPPSELHSEPKSLRIEPDNAVLFGKLNGRQEVRIKLKQGESVQGPKVEFVLNLGSLTIFSSPRQLHLLMELMNGFASPSTQDNSNVTCRPRPTHKPMDKHDYECVEQQLMHLLNSGPKAMRESKGLQTMQGWSTASVGGDDSDEEFHPARGVRNGRQLSDSVFSDATSMEGSVISTVSSSTYLSKSQSDVYSTPSQTTTPSRSKSKRKGSPGDSDPGAEISTFHISLGSLAVVLLHEDVMTCSPETGLLAPSSVAEMTKMAETFFEKLGLLSLGGYGNRDFDSVSETFVEACGTNHLRLFAAPVIIEGDEKTTSSSKLFSSVITAANVELLECLIEKIPTQVVSKVEYVELLKFMRPNRKEGEPQPISSFSSESDIWIHFKRVEKTVRTNHPRIPQTEINVTLQQCWSEVDISIVDRITAILNPRSVCKPVNRRVASALFQNQQSGFHQAVESTAAQDSKKELKIKSPFFVIKLRIPIADLRPISDFSRPEWWKRSVRKDILIFNLTEALFTTASDTRDTVQEFNLQCKEIKLLFQEGEASQPIPFALATADDKSGTTVPGGGQGFGWPRIVLRISPRQKLADLEDLGDNEQDGMPPMACSIVMETPEKQPSPFSSKKIVHESDTSHNVECEGEELIIPGDREEMSEFIEVASSNTRTQLEINLPCLRVNFPTKHLYEVIYNRVNSDLLMWEAVAPKQSSPDLSQSDFIPSIYHDACFSQCKSGTHYESDSDPEDSSEMGYNTWEQYKQKKPVQINRNGQSKITITLNVGHGRLNAYTNVRDGTGSEHGELQINFKEVNLFTVTGYQGLSHNNYICLQINHTELFHNGELSMANLESPSVLETELRAPPASHLRPTLYKTERGAVTSVNASPVGTGSSTSKDMITLAIWSHVKETKVKIIRVACGIRGATLRHHVTLGKHGWFNQLLEFFEVMDYPVPGYHPLQVITELHQHLWDCAIDYRPLKLQLRSMVTLGNLSVSSNMAARTSSSALRFIAEDVCLFISNKSGNSVDLRSDYVCVLDFGLFELSLRLSDSPRVDLRASNNVVHIRTCSDSAHSLAQLITYFACDGDLEDKRQSSTVVEDMPEPEMSNVLHSLPDAAVEQVNILMEEAMQDMPRPNGSGLNDQDAEGVQVFFFPDEKGGVISSKIKCGQGSHESMETHWASHLDCKDSDSGDSMKDWSIIDCESLAGSGVIPPDGVPVVKHLITASVHIVDNHFTKPASKSDFLKSPASFPPSVFRYSLREMTLVWHMYGGQDFGIESSPKKHVTIAERDKPSSDLKKRHSIPDTTVTFSSSKPQEVNLSHGSHHSCHGPSCGLACDKHSHHGGYRDFHERSVPSKFCNIPTKWQERGGKGRQHDILMELQLNKVRFQCDVYGKTCEKAARQVLLIQEMEIRDRLATSEMNKFLHHYSSTDCPKQNSANMVRIRALHIRPEPTIDVQECKMKVSLLPLKLNIDQDALLFLFTFANEISDANKTEGDSGTVAVREWRSSQPPVMSVEQQTASERVQASPQLSYDNKQYSEKPRSSPVFFREFNFTPEVRIRLDYQGKRVDMTHGPLAGLLMGLAQLSNSEIRLIRLSHHSGLLGIERLLSYVITEWLQDIKKNQLPAILGGVGPINSLVQLAQGIRDLFWLPIEQYQKDGRIVRGLQRGANSFTTSTAMAALEITTRIVQAIQCVAETAFDMVSPGPSVRSSKHGKNNRYNQPADIREGVTKALELVREGLGETAQTLVRVASSEHETKGAVGAVGGVLRQLPPTVVAPIIIASAATNNLLGGVRSQLVPDARREHTLKWRSEENK